MPDSCVSRRVREGRDVRGHHRSHLAVPLPRVLMVQSPQSCEPWSRSKRKMPEDSAPLLFLLAPREESPAFVVRKSLVCRGWDGFEPQFHFASHGHLRDDVTGLRVKQRCVAPYEVTEASGLRWLHGSGLRAIAPGRRGWRSAAPRCLRSAQSLQPRPPARSLPALCPLSALCLPSVCPVSARCLPALCLPQLAIPPQTTAGNKLAFSMSSFSVLIPADTRENTKRNGTGCLALPRVFRYRGI